MTSERSKQVEMLESVYCSIADLTQSRERLQEQIAALDQQAAKYDSLAARARELGREDLAQEALARQGTVRSQLAGMASQLDLLTAERAKLTTAAQKLQAKIDGAAGSTAR